MPRSVAVFDMENHDNLPLTQEHAMRWDEKITRHLYGENMTAKLGYLCHKFWIENINYVKNLTL